MDEHLRAVSAEEQAQQDFDNYVLQANTEFLGVPAPAPIAPAAPPARSFSLKGILPLAAAVGGAYFGHKKWRQHRWLGAFAGFTAAGGAAEILVGDRKIDGAIAIASSAAAVAVGKKWHKHPIAGFVGTIVAAPVLGRYVVSKVRK